MNTKISVVFSIIAITAVLLAFAAGPVVSTRHEQEEKPRKYVSQYSTSLVDLV